MAGTGQAGYSGKCEIGTDWKVCLRFFCELVPLADLKMNRFEVHFQICQ